jgi:hypothetical protein
LGLPRHVGADHKDSPMALTDEEPADDGNDRYGDAIPRVWRPRVVHDEDGLRTWVREGEGMLTGKSVPQMTDDELRKEYKKTRR